MCGDAPGPGGTTTVIGTIVFAQSASPYAITITPVLDIVYPSILEIYGIGIQNDSGATQNFVTANSSTEKASARIYFNNFASADRDVVITNQGGASASGDGVYGGFTSFEDNSTAGRAVIVNNGAL